MSRQLPRLTDSTPVIEHRPIWKRIPPDVGYILIGVVAGLLLWLAGQGMGGL